jgi:hypothetical protein
MTIPNPRGRTSLGKHHHNATLPSSRQHHARRQYTDIDRPSLQAQSMLASHSSRGVWGTWSRQACKSGGLRLGGQAAWSQRSGRSALPGSVGFLPMASCMDAGRPYAVKPLKGTKHGAVAEPFHRSFRGCGFFFSSAARSLGLEFPFDKAIYCRWIWKLDCVKQH